MLTPSTKLNVCAKQIFTLCLKNSVQVTVKMIQTNFALLAMFHMTGNNHFNSD